MGRRDFPQVEGHGVRRGWKGRKVLLPAPLFEVTPVGAVGAQGGIAFGGADVLPGLAGQAFEFSRFGREAGGSGCGGC